MRHPRFFQDEAVKIPVIPAQAWTRAFRRLFWIPSLRGNDGHGGDGSLYIIQKCFQRPFDRRLTRELLPLYLHRSTSRPAGCAAWKFPKRIAKKA
jgi:hypothetical protein